jgi:hypothetical protein
MATVCVTRPMAGDALCRMKAVAETRLWDGRHLPPAREVVFPQIVSAGLASRTKMANLAADSRIAGPSGQPPANLGNPEVMSS